MLYSILIMTFNVFRPCRLFAQFKTVWNKALLLTSKELRSRHQTGKYFHTVNAENYCLQSIYLSFVRVCVNLQIGPNVAPRDSVALHVALDFNRNAIVRNSIQGQSWGVEESHGPPVALVRGQQFKLDILCDAYEYRVSIWL